MGDCLMQNGCRPVCIFLNLCLDLMQYGLNVLLLRIIKLDSVLVCVDGFLFKVLLEDVLLTQLAGKVSSRHEFCISGLLHYCMMHMCIGRPSWPSLYV